MIKSKADTKKNNLFERFANAATKFTGSSIAFIAATAIVILWAVTGPVFDYSETWQLVINTGTTIITFLMVFLIQKAQNKDGKAIQLKLNELIAAHEKASNRMVDIEDLTEKDLDQLHKFYVTLATLAKKEADIHCSHSIDVANELNELKLEKNKHFKHHNNESASSKN
ncbi:low affinity iron permease family protein [Pedobacter sp. HDW13]|uniref:low affinity iron permease family protein n=1 Tax=unclassified Pedobacter TaxID=2628915 RepID=UPI000F59A883|nr:MULTISPECIES: low affinity iron permease family protein [unclassified Pedobacter]QIL38142.1 low affinity iron permease family protein [Pedobacter sp. HDW13]RQO69104.1 low affinity iron permease family protein [Pedobacter sp. KBW01]